jgi:hypothetical protein
MLAPRAGQSRYALAMSRIRKFKNPLEMGTPPARKHADGSICIHGRWLT